MKDSIQRRLQVRLENEPSGRAFAYYKSDGSFTWRTYEEFHLTASKVAQRLSEKSLGKGDVCLIVMPSTEEAAASVMGILLLGGIPLLVSPPVMKGSLLDLPRILSNTASRTKAKIVLCDESLEEIKDDLKSQCPDTEFVFGFDTLSTESAVPEFEPVFPDEDEVASYQLTSGTTGFPRVCVWSQKGVLAALDGMQDAMQVTKEDVFFNWTPLYHDMGLINNFMLCITAGIPMVMASPHDFVKKPAMWLKGVHDTGATTTWSPNFGFALAAARVKDHHLDGVRLEHVRGFWNAAERIHYSTMQDFYERFKAFGLSYNALKTNFGCAENVGGATFSDPNGPFVVEHLNRDSLYEEHIALPAADDTPPEEVVSIVSAGMPHTTMKIYALSDEGEKLPEGHVGQVALETPSRLLTYLDDQESTDYAIRDGLLLTGDLGYVRDNNLFWVGRVKERITIRGKKLDPSDFEPVLFDIEGLRKGCFVVFGMDDPKSGTQKIVVVSEVKQPAERSLSEIKAEILKECYLRLGMTVNEVQLLKPATLAKTSSGKRRHRHFKHLFEKGALSQYQASDISEEAPSVS